jgi:hypothetical protein
MLKSIHAIEDGGGGGHSHAEQTKLSAVALHTKEVIMQALEQKDSDISHVEQEMKKLRRQKEELLMMQHQRPSAKGEASLGGTGPGSLV